MSYLDRVFENKNEAVVIPNPITFSEDVVFSKSVDLSASTLTGLTLTASVVAPDADDGAALGSTSLKWSDLFLASGAVINFNSGNVTLTHGSNVLTIAGGVAVFSGGARVADDQTLLIGSTVATAETNISLEFDETTTGIGLFNMGSGSVPMVLNANPGATVIAHVININHSAGAGDCDDLIAQYTKVNVIGAGDSGLTAVGQATRAYVGLTGGANNSVAAQAYAIQPWAKHEGTGAITAMSAVSAKLDVSADNFTASTINAGHFHIEGAATVTGQFDGVMIEVYPDVTCLDSMLALAVDSVATVAAGIRATGAFTSLFSLVTGAGCTHGGAAAAAVQGYITISVGGNPYRIPYLANSDS